MIGILTIKAIGNSVEQVMCWLFQRGAIPALVFAVLLGGSVLQVVPSANAQQDCMFLSCEPGGKTAPPPVDPATQAYAPSFNCGQDLSATELAICNSGELSKMDMDLAGLYALAKSRMSKSAFDMVKNTQRSWLKARNACGPDVACIKRAYQSQLDALRNF